MIGVPAQDLPENQDKDVRYTMLHATNQKIPLDEKGEPTVKLGSNGFPVDEDEAKKLTEPAKEKGFPDPKKFSNEAKKDQNLVNEAEAKDMDSKPAKDLPNDKDAAEQPNLPGSPVASTPSVKPVQEKKAK